MAGGSQYFQPIARVPSMKATMASLFLVSFLAVGCKSDDKKGGDDLMPDGLMMSSDSAACKQAMKCCEAMVRDEKPAAGIEDMNISCSGVALATTDDECGQFKDGYVAAFTYQEKETPADCK